MNRQSLHSIMRRLRRDRRGVAAVELAVIAPFLVIALVGVVELGVAIRQRMQVQDAAAAGAFYAAQHGWDSAAISNAVTNAKSGSSITASPEPALYCGCPSSSGTVTANCTDTCADGYPARQYVLVSALVTRSTFLPSGLPLPATLSATATARLP